MTIVLGTVNSGDWHGTVIPVPKGGTGMSSMIPSSVITSDDNGLPMCDNANFRILTSGLQLKGNNINTTPPAGFIGETMTSFVPLASAVTLSNNTPANVTSISLTPGIYDLSALGMFTAASLLTGGSSRVSMNTTSQTEGTAGLNKNMLPLVAILSSSDLGITIPKWRQELAVITTVYLVLASSFTLGSCKGYGNITATRVG